MLGLKQIYFLYSFIKLEEIKPYRNILFNSIRNYTHFCSDTCCVRLQQGDIPCLCNNDDYLFHICLLLRSKEICLTRNVSGGRWYILPSTQGWYGGAECSQQQDHLQQFLVLYHFQSPVNHTWCLFTYAKSHASALKTRHRLSSPHS